jgi:transcriptional regulator with XRE-family HTH domain
MRNESFADRLRALREKAGLTTYALAKKCGLTKQALYRLESGSSEPTWQTVQLLAAALGVDCSAFVDPALMPPPEKPARPRGKPKKNEGDTPPTPSAAKRAGKAKRKKA